MKRHTSIAVGFVGVLGLSGLLTNASAGCNPPKPFTLGFAPAGDYRITVPAGVNGDIGSGVVKGRFWTAGNRAGANEGLACPEATYMFQLGDSAMTLFGMSGADVLGTGPCDNEGCVAGDMVIVVQTLSNDGRKAYYAGGKVSENTDGHDYSRGGTDWPFVEVPRPLVTGSGRSGPIIFLNIRFDPPWGVHGEADGYPPSSILTGYQLVMFDGPSDPGRDPASWTNLGGVTPVTDAGATVYDVQGVFCTTWTNDVFLAMRPVFDGGQFSGDYVGASTRIICDWRVADPRFKMIDRPQSGRGTIRSNPR